MKRTTARLLLPSALIAASLALAPVATADEISVGEDGCDVGVTTGTVTVGPGPVVTWQQLPAVTWDISECDQKAQFTTE